MIYLDNSATTQPLPEAAQAAARAMTDVWGNPSALHDGGLDALELLDESRKAVAKALGCTPAELYFTSGGTAADNTAIFGAALARRRAGNRVVTTSAEHPAVARACDRLEALGCEVTRLPARADGGFELSALEEALSDKTILVSCMAVNNELGTITDIPAVSRVVRRCAKNALFHVDAVQAFGKLPFRADKCGADLVAVSAHKIHGIKGAGALYVKKGVRVEPFLVGGGQERGLVSGTEPMPAIAAFAEAAKRIGDPAQHLAHARALRSALTDALADCPHVAINSPADGLPYIVNLSLTGVPSQPAVNALCEMGVYVSAGSACKRGHRSEVLTAVHLPPERIDSAIRVSFSRFNTVEEAYAAAAAIRKTIERIRR